MNRNLGRQFKQGEVIFRQGEPAMCMYVIQKGRVEIYVESEYGTNHLVTLEEGDVFGEISLFAEKARFATARATEDTSVITLDEKTFVSKLHQDPSLAFRMIRQMARRVYDQDHSLMYGFFEAGKRHHDMQGFVSYIDLVALVEEELSRAQRLWQTLAVAIIDVDHFSVMHEKFGSVIGEDLVKSLAEALRDILRRQDVIGRFSDNRFGLLLYEADGPAAVRVLEKVRKAFAGLWHRLGQPEMTGVFSCGIATYPDYKNVTDLNKAAYKALAASKKTGNEVILSNPSGKIPASPP